MRLFEVASSGSPHKGKFMLLLQRPEDKQPQQVTVLTKNKIATYTQMLQKKFPDAKITAELIEDIGDDQYPDITQSKKEEIINAWEYQEDLIDIGNGYQILSGENHGRADNVALLIGPDYKIKDEDTDIEKLLDNNFGIIQGENFADGKKKGKSRPGRVKRSGASCNGSVTALRKRAKNSSGEKAKMLHWCANMKSGKQKSK